MSKNQSLSLRTQWLGSRLKAARVAAGLTLKEAADQLQLVDTTLSRFEKGAVRVRRPYVTEMIDYYSISDPRERDALTRLNEDAWRKDWWDGDTSDFETGFLDYTWLEARASKIHAFSPLLIHGLLQTVSYAESVAKRGLSSTHNDETIARLVELRVTRQNILDDQPPTELTVILEEPALRRPVGGDEVLADQLRHLTLVSKRQHIDVRVLPNSVGWDAGYAGPFTYFEMPDPYPEVAYVENLAGRTFLEDETKVARFRQTYDELYATALGPRKSVELVQDLLKDYS